MVNPAETFEIQGPGTFHEVDLRNSNERVNTRKAGFIVDRRFWIVVVGCVGVLAVVGIAVGASQGTADYSKSLKDDETVQKDFSSQIAQSLTKLTKALHSVAHEKKSETKIEEAKKTVNKISSKSLKADDSICNTPECTKSANLILQSMNSSVDPCDDFYEFACGGWIADNPLNGSSLGTFYEANDLLQERLELLLESSGDPEDPIALFKIRIYYDTCLDTEVLDANGLGELTDELDRQGGWPMVGTFDDSKFVLESAIVGVQKLRVVPLVAVGNAGDFHNTSVKILYVTEGGLGISPTYLLDPANYTEEMAAYKTYITTSAKLVRDSLNSAVTDEEIDADADDMIAFEINLANVMDQVKFHRPSDFFDQMTVGGLQNWTDTGSPDQFLWLNYFKTLFAGTGVTINSDEPCYVIAGAFMPDLAVLLSETSDRTLANYLGWWWTMVTGPETTDAMREAMYTFDEAVYGSSNPRPRTTHCVDQTNYNFGFATSRSYVDDYFTEEARVENQQLVIAITNAFNELMVDVTWMVDGDKILAEEKLEAIKKFVAYPDWIMDDEALDIAYGGMEVLPSDHYGNILRLADFIRFSDLSTFRESPELAFTAMPPTVCNAYYSPFSNSINILVGILQSPFYSHGTLEALNFGGIGMVIGHELTHGFDNDGRRFDKDGNWAQWWTEESVENFKNLSQCFVDQYDVYSPPELAGTEFEDRTVDGKQTLGENIADNGGIREAYLAYRNRREFLGEEEKRLAGLDEFTPDQLFFLSFANLWCEHKTVSSINYQLDADPHSPGRFRVVGSVSNDEDFARTYQCGPETNMNRGDDRCVLW